MTDLSDTDTAGGSARAAEPLKDKRLDPADSRLLALLQTDARLSTSELARRLGLSRSTVQSRMQRLRERGIITGFTVQLGEAYASQLVRAHVLIKVAQKLTGLTLARLPQMPGVMSLYAISGDYDLIAVVAAQSTQELSRLLDEIANLEGIERTNSSVILETKFDRS